MPPYRGFLGVDYSDATDSKARVRVSAELRQCEIVLVRLLKQFHIKPTAPMSLRSVKAQNAARARWSKG